MMVSGLVAGYGVLASHAGRFLYPNSAGSVAWQFVTTIDQLPVGKAFAYVTPGGAKIVVTRQAEGDETECFVALSSVCPHLGCAVHWEPQNERFFCPCHNGAFDASGKATKGPPASAKQELKRFPLKVDDGLLFIEIPTQTISGPQGA